MWVLIMILFMPADPELLIEAQRYVVPLEYTKTWEDCSKEAQRLAIDWVRSYPDEPRDAVFTCARKDYP